MISKAFDIEEFVDVVKCETPQNVISLAIREATKADRKLLKNRNFSEKEELQRYSRQLKRLVNYHRCTVKIRGKERTTYDLYMKHWGGPSLAGDDFDSDIQPDAECQFIVA